MQSPVLLASILALLACSSPSDSQAAGASPPAPRPVPTEAGQEEPELAAGSARAPERQEEVREALPQGDAPAQGELTQERLEALAREIQADVERIRGRAFQRDVEVALASREQLREYFMGRIEKLLPPEKLANQETVAKLLGLLPPEMDYLETTLGLLDEQVGGFYDPEAEAFYLMEGFQGGLAPTILAHELTHALDDQLHDIDGKLTERLEDEDAGYAFHAVVEGSGTAVMNVFTIEQVKQKKLDLAALGEMDLGMDAMAGLPEFLWKPLLFSYVRGNTFLARTDKLLAAQMRPLVPADIDRAFREPPRSSEQVLHPQKYWDEAALDEPRPVALDLENLPEGWEVLEQNTFGELGLALVAKPAAERDVLDPENPFSVMAVRYTSDAAAGWGGDRFALLGKGDARALFVATVWDSPEDAAEFAAGLEAMAPDLREPLAELGRLRAGRDAPSDFRILGPTEAGGAQVRFASSFGVPASEVDALLERIGVSLGPP